MHFNFMNFLMDLLLIKNSKDDICIGLTDLNQNNKGLSEVKINSFKKKQEINISDLMSGRVNISS